MFGGRRGPGPGQSQTFCTAPSRRRPASSESATTLLAGVREALGSSARQTSTATAIARSTRLPISRVRQATYIRKPFMAKLDGKIALISGGTTGIGAATAKLFQSEGATVVVTGSSQKSVDAAKTELPGIEALVSNAGDVAATK